MATLSKSNLAFRGNWGLVTLTEAASNTAKANDPVALTSNKVAMVAADADITTSVVPIGFLAEDASGVTDAAIQVWVPMDETAWFRTSVDHATPASAVTAVSQIGTNYVVTNSATGGAVIAIDTTSNAVAKVMEIDPNFPLGERYGWVWARFLTSADTYNFA